VSNHSGKQFNIKRRDFLRLLGSGAIGLAAGDALAGCGGGSGGAPNSNQNPVLFQESRQIASSGDTITDTLRGLSLNVPANTLNHLTTITLTIRRDQIIEATPKGFTANPNAIEITFDAAAMLPNGTFILQIPWAGNYTSIGTVVFLKNTAGTILPVTTSYDANQRMITGTISKPDVVAVAKNNIFNVFIANADISEGTKAAAKVFVPSSSRRIARAATNKRVAVIVHGILNQGENVAPIALYLNSDQFKLPTGGTDSNHSATGKVYDYTDNTFSYDYLDHIANNGTRLAQYIRSQYGDADVVDIYAHSMGGLVSRFAIEQAGLGSRIRQVVTLGTPHTGVPLRIIQLFLFLILPDLYEGLTLTIPGLIDLLQDSAFLTALNKGASPISSTAYRTVGGTSYANFKGNLGGAIEAVYYVLNGLTHIEHDGIVPLTSALAVGNPERSTALNHSELVDKIAIRHLIDDWIVTPLTGTLQ
jgi:triacylglycerol esterase/lipase EstA (alpha/beta hydrolase family)